MRALAEGNRVVKEARTKALVVTNLFPSNVDPGFAPYHREQFAALGRRASVEILGGVPWALSRLLENERPGGAIRREVIDGLAVRHPRVAAIPGLPVLSGLLMAATVAPTAWWRSRQLRADVLLAASAYPEGVAGMLLARWLRLPLVVKVHGPDLKVGMASPGMRRQLRAALHAAARVIVTCDGLLKYMDELGVRRDWVRVVYDGVDRGRFRPRGLRSARRRSGLPIERDLVLYAGRLTEEAGLLTFLDVAERLHRRRPDVTFVVAGDGPLEPLLHRASERGVKSPIIPVGHLPQLDMAEYMAASDLVCVPSRQVGLPHVIREALASGRPVIATDTPCTREVLVSEELGRCVPAGDVDRWVEAILATLDETPFEPASRVALAALPTWDDSAQRLLATLDEARALRRR